MQDTTQYSFLNQTYQFLAELDPNKDISLTQDESDFLTKLGFLFSSVSKQSIIRFEATSNLRSPSFNGSTVRFKPYSVESLGVLLSASPTENYSTTISIRSQSRKSIKAIQHQDQLKLWWIRSINILGHVQLSSFLKKCQIVKVRGRLFELEYKSKHFCAYFTVRTKEYIKNNKSTIPITPPLNTYLYSSGSRIDASQLATYD